jgi:hypothetical protein
MIGDVVKVVHEQWTINHGTIKGYKAFSDPQGNPARDVLDRLQGMVTPREFNPGTVGIVATPIEKVAPNGIEAIGITIKFAPDDPGELWWFPLKNIRLR